jgi:hypothetical protein
MLGAPAVAAALTMCVVESARVLQPGAPLFASPFVYSLADAIERNDVDAAHAFIRSGQHPNQPIAVQHPTLTRGRRVLVAPLVWAAATQSRDAVLMLVGYGATPDQASARAAVCIAAAHRNDELSSALNRLGVEPSADGCPARSVDEWLTFPPPQPTAGSADADGPRPVQP